MAEKTPLQVVNARIEALDVKINEAAREMAAAKVNVDLYTAVKSELIDVRMMLRTEEERDEETTRLAPGEIERKVTDLLRNDGVLRRMSEDHLATSTGFKRNSLRAALRRMVEAKTIESTESGYQLVAAPDSPPGRPHAPSPQGAS